jgi:hypothetical protein
MGSTRFPWILLLGDVITFALVTLFGFATHGTLDTAGLRMLTTFFPVLAAWLLFAPFSGVYQPDRAADFRSLWRPFLAMVLAAPFAAWIRGVWLDTVILPVFVVVLGGICALAIIAWRTLYCLVLNRRSMSYG